MNLNTHLVRHDVRRFKWLIVLWLVVITGAIGSEGLLPVIDQPITDPWRASPLQAAAGLLGLTAIVFAAILIAVLVHAHPVVGSTAFWMTRPIPPMTLLGSKMLLLVVLFVLVPAVLDVVTMAAYHVPATRVASVVVVASLLRLAGVVIIAALAAFTSSLARFAVLSAGILVVLALGITTAAWWLLWTADADEGIGVVSAGPSTDNFATGGDASGAIAAVLFAILSGMVLLRWQYARSAFCLTVPFAVLVAVIALFLPELWPWHVLRAQVTPPEWSTGVSLRASPESVVVDKQGIALGFPGTGRRARIVRAATHTEGMPPHAFGSAALTRGILTHGAGTIESGPAFGATLPAAPQTSGSTHRSVLDVLNVRVLACGNLPALPMVQPAALMLVREDQLPSGPAIDGAYRGEFRLDLFEATVAASFPLDAAPAVFQEGALRVVLRRVFWGDSAGGDGAVRVDARISNARSIREDRGTHWTAILRNTRTGDAVCADYPSLGEEVFPGMPLGLWGVHLDTSGGIGEFGARTQRLAFMSTHVPISGPVTPPADVPARASELVLVRVDETWLKEAEFVILRTRPLGSIRRTLEMDGVRLALQ